MNEAAIVLHKALRPHFVYFARVGDYIKVGCSHNPRQRLAAIRRTWSPPLDLWAPTELIRAVPAGTRIQGHSLEGAYQAALSDFHAGGEWFHAAPDVLTWIDSLDPALGPWDQQPPRLANTG